MEKSAEPKKATANDIVTASLTGEIPEWFTEQDREAVKKLLS